MNTVMTNENCKSSLATRPKVPQMLYITKNMQHISEQLTVAVCFALAPMTTGVPAMSSLVSLGWECRIKRSELPLKSMTPPETRGIQHTQNKTRSKLHWRFTDAQADEAGADTPSFCTDDKL